MENPELAKKEEETFTVTLTFEEGAVLGLNLMQHSMLARVGIARLVAPEVLATLVKKFKEATSASNQSPAGESGPEAGSNRDTSSGESSGSGAVPVSEPS